MSGINIKICGLKDAAACKAAADAGARYLGFNFFPKSPRYVSPTQAAALAVDVPIGVCKVGLVVDMEDDVLEALLNEVPLDMIQLHGHESPERVLEVKARFGLPVMKAVGVRDADDLPSLEAYARVADQILVDAKPPRGAVLPGGNGLPFDWRLIAGRRWDVPWMLAGGLTPDNVGQAIAMTGARQVDLSSGVETSPGVKDAALMSAFCQAVLSE
ncbi:phosphoribosylanthranilate isomerase [Sulfitobacter sp. TSTF-M16]|uniref:N-(5'-phosphoribosyl)anthranilate isomerase n=1 Tax=Sulfitobacter aestuariivivens TaxID=2766981 RepID=A0A927D2U9_9RHOB|nr:phosphoribosylanthranilate isomerase [Sulfitobacter aestuariivivens]MBD3662297.1 phosphoribosylanthranilate isomerase [Sulfitobacter aestuariivivens]